MISAGIANTGRDSHGGWSLLGLATTIPGEAPEAFEPDAPILFKTPCLAVESSVESHVSSDDCLLSTGDEVTAVSDAASSKIFLRSNIFGS